MSLRSAGSRLREIWDDIEKDHNDRKLRPDMLLQMPEFALHRKIFDSFEALENLICLAKYGTFIEIAVYDTGIVIHDQVLEGLKPRRK